MRNAIEALQPLGRALMLPIAVLPIAALLLRLGQADMLDIPFVAPAPADPDALERPGPKATEDDHLRFLAQRRALLDEHRERALSDDFGHGTHVAGIIAGAARAGVEIRLLERTEHVNPQGELERGRFELAGADRDLAGVDVPWHGDDDDGADDRLDGLPRARPPRQRGDVGVDVRTPEAQVSTPTLRQATAPSAGPA